MPGIGATARDKRKIKGVPDAAPPDAADAARLASGEDGPENDRKGANGVGLEHSFALEYTDQRGRVWRGNFTTKILSVKDRMTLGMTKSRLGAGLSPQQIDTPTDQIMEIVAHLSVSLSVMPKWAEDLMSVYDLGVLGAIYEEVVTHEARFHGAEAEGSGSDAG